MSKNAYEKEVTIVFSTAHVPCEEYQKMVVVAKDPSGFSDVEFLEEFRSPHRSDEFGDTFSRVNASLERDAEEFSTLQENFPHIVTLVLLGWSLGATHVRLDGEGPKYEWLKQYNW